MAMENSGGGAVKDVLVGVQCVVMGCYHSLVGLLPVISLVQRNKKIRKQLLQCFLLNGVILGLSILVFDYVFLPSVQHCIGKIYGVVISSPVSDSYLLFWLSTILQYLFTGLWVLPVFWISKPINLIWCQDIAYAALNESQKSTKTRPATPSSHSPSVSQTLSRLIADFLFSVLLQLLFLLQAMAVGLIPGIGWMLSALHMTLLYSLYCFEYKWMHDGWPVHKRVAYLERRWPYFIGFGLPLTVLTTWPSSLVISACIFAVTFPLFIISATSVQPLNSPLPSLPIFNMAIHLTNRLASVTCHKRGPRVTHLASKFR